MELNTTTDSFDNIVEIGDTIVYPLSHKILRKFVVECICPQGRPGQLFVTRDNKFITSYVNSDFCLVKKKD